MQSILLFDGPSQKRRKALRACQRCKDSKKRCDVVDGRNRCQRCDDDDAPCSLQDAIAAQVKPPSQDLGHISPVLSVPDGYGRAVQTPTAPFPSGETPSIHLSHGMSPSDPGVQSQSKMSEQRYATMLSLLEKETTVEHRDRSTKLISGTNPLSALLGKNLKHKIVTNSCSFRTPDPTARGHRPTIRRGGTIHSYDWEQHYRNLGTPETRLQYLRAVKCFQLPPPSECSLLLEIYISQVHPVLPILDRKELLASYYGSGEPPSLVVLHAIFLAAYRYVPGGPQSEDDVSEIRTHCDDLHSRLHALIEAEVTTDRMAVVQASLLASLHWEGREGLNSAIDNLSLAVRICQELGFHRKQQGLLSAERNAEDKLQRRLWWCTYALDRLNAAQEGTPFLINEMDCDIEPLTVKDFADEDQLTRQATLANVLLAQIIEDAVRSLYGPGEDHTTLFTSRGVLQRQTLALRLEQLAAQIKDQLMSGKAITACGLHENPPDSAALCGAFLLTHLDAVRILVHRPFILHQEPPASGLYTSRDACRGHSLEILFRLQYLLNNNLLGYSWPFTVYAVVNCLLIFWYDISSPPSGEVLAQARQHYTSVVNLLRVMGTTWWAAAAKHKLAQALARAASALHQPARPADTAAGGIRVQHGEPLTPLQATESGQDIYWADDMMFADCDMSDFWGSMGLDFDLDVASNIFSIGHFDDPAS